MLSRGAEAIPTNAGRSSKNSFDNTVQGNEKLVLPCFDFTSQQEFDFSARFAGTFLPIVTMP